MRIQKPMASGRLLVNKGYFNVSFSISTVTRNVCQDHQITVLQIRHFFNSEKLKGRKKEYHDRKLVGYSMDQMFSVVADVEKYRQFLPFCNKSDILLKKTDFLRANLTIGFPPIKENYISNVTLRKPFLVQAICSEGKLFDYLETSWKFMPGLKTVDQSCVIDFYVSFQFKSLLHSQLSHIFFDQLVQQMEKAFINEAERRYGKPTTKVIQLSSLVEA